MIYVVTPFDIVPDFVPGVGLLDNVAVVAWVIKKLKDEIDAFRAHQANEDDPEPQHA